MARKAYVGDTDGTPLQIPIGYIGGNDGVAIRLLKGYVGDKDGLARQFWGAKRSIRFVYDTVNADPSYVYAELPDGSLFRPHFSNATTYELFCGDIITFYVYGYNSNNNRYGYVKVNGVEVFRNESPGLKAYEYKVTKNATVDLDSHTYTSSSGTKQHIGTVDITETE